MDGIRADSINQEVPSRREGKGATICELDKSEICRPSGQKFRRKDFFELDGKTNKLIFKQGALEKLGKLSAGRVSFLFDTDIEAYPQRRIEGKSIPGIPYLKFDSISISKFHEDTIKDYAKVADYKGDITKISLPPKAHTLYDMAFPNPASDKVGLYLASDIPIKYIQASEEWKAKNGVIVQKQVSETGEITIISGPFLKLGSLEKYAAKYALALQATIAAIKSGPGKWMLYHHRVRLSGVLILQEIFKMNGFIDDISPAGPDTICGICAVPQKAHKSVGGHAYVPARFIMAHYRIPRTTMDANIEKFIAPSNVDGYQYRLLIGSRIIRQSYDLRAVQGQYTLSFVTDIPTLLQIWGRVIRKGSALDLPEDRRYAILRTFATPLELSRYEEKMKDYVLIQEVEREFRKYAVDGFANYPKLARAFPELESGVATIDALPYKPIVMISKEKDKGKDLENSSFKAFYVRKYISYIERIIKALFKVRIVYTYKDLVDDVRKRGAVRGVVVDPHSFTESEIALAVKNILDEPHPGTLLYFPPYLIRRSSIMSPASIEQRPGKLEKNEISIEDVESYIRAPATIKTVFNINYYIKHKREDKNFTTKLAAMEREEFKHPEDIILSYDIEFHIRLLPKLIETIWQTGPLPRDGNLDLALKEYKKFEIIRYVDDIDPNILKVNKIHITSKSRPVAYVVFDVLHILDPTNFTWREIKLNEKMVPENDYIIGYMEKKSGKIKLKLRQSLEILKKIDLAEAKMLSRGAVCETKFRRDQLVIAKKLGVDTEGSSQRICENIKYKLVQLEEKQLTKKRENRIKWFYFFNETVPHIR